MTEELAAIILNHAEELIGADESPERLLEALDEAEKLLPQNVALLCRSARLLFRYGIFNSKGRFFLLALDKLKAAEERDPYFFETASIWWQLWGNILVQMGKLLKDSVCYENAIEKYQKALKIAKEGRAEIYWDLADAWTLLGQLSKEPSDFTQALFYFSVAEQNGISTPFFKLDYGSAFGFYGELRGDPSILADALSYYRSVIAETYDPKEEPSVAYIVAWRKLALFCKIRYQFSHRKNDLEEADAAFRDAILASPRNGDIWLDWCELFLHAGWLKRDVKLLEVGLDKLTSNKVKECDPVRIALLLGLGLNFFGLFLENLKMIKDGQDKIRAAKEAAPEHPDLVYASTFADFGLALYFSDEEAFAKCATLFEKGVQEGENLIQNLHALFQTYLAWGLLEKNVFLVEKGIQAISHLATIAPYSPIYLNEWGVALLRMRQLENSQERVQSCIEEGIEKFKKAYELCEEEDTLYNWGCALDLLGDITADEDDYAKAIDLLTKLFEKRHNELHVRHHLGLAFSHLGELTLNGECLHQAVELLESVVKMDPDDDYYWCDLGYALLNLSVVVTDSIYPEEGERFRHEAEKALLRAAELGNGDAFYHLACLYSLSGLYDVSIRYLKKAESADTLPCKEDLEHDEWLDGLKETDAFQDFLTSQGENG